MIISLRPVAAPIQPRYSPKQADWEAYAELCGEYQVPDHRSWTKETLDDEVNKLLDHLQEAKRRVTPIIEQRTLSAARKTREILCIEGQLRGLIRKMELGIAQVYDFRRLNTKRQRLRTLYCEQASRKWEEMVKKGRRCTESCRILAPSQKDDHQKTTTTHYSRCKW